MDFLHDIKEKHKIQSVSFNNQNRRQLVSRPKRKTLLSNIGNFNGHAKSQFSPGLRRRNQDNKENLNAYNTLSSLKPLLPKKSFNFQKTFQSAEKMKIKKIEFFDELNGKYVKKNLFEEKLLHMETRMPLPKIKDMKVDNDVMTDDEQKSDALWMMRDNLAETIKLISSNKAYLKTNLSKLIKFRK